jgi:uncharacterized protein YkwD
LRKLAAAALAVPILASFYIPVLLRRSVAARLGIAIGIGGIIGIAALGALAPALTTAKPPSSPAPVASAAFGPSLRTDVAPSAGVAISFSRPMDPATVAAALNVSPTASISLEWDTAGTLVTVHPRVAWALDTLYTITVGAIAADRQGHPLGGPMRTAFVTRPATTGSILPTIVHGDAADVSTAFELRFDHPVDVAAAEAAFAIQPHVAGAFAPADGSATADEIVFTPTALLTAGATYTVSLSRSIADADGATTSSPVALAVRTAAGPKVVRFRPRNGTTDVAVGARLSVRFTQPMDRVSTAAAFSVTANGKPVTGKLSWAENDTVLVLVPSSALPKGALIGMTVAATAQAASGAGLASAATATARVTAPHAVTAPTAKATRSAKPVPIHRASGGSVGSGSWYAVETYYLRLMNCTRTGGWVTSSGSCSSPGGLSTKPIVLDAGLSNRVSRPYAKLLATSGQCQHFYEGSPNDRLHRAGYSGWLAENIGCRSASNAYDSVLGTHLFFQSEKPCGGYCHYANLMNPAYSRCGIGVWVGNGRIRLVVDFYHS